MFLFTTPVLIDGESALPKGMLQRKCNLDESCSAKRLPLDEVMK
jgi:hypothetical protein